MVRRVWRPRVLIICALLGTSTAFVASPSLRPGFSVDVIKDRGAQARIVEQGAIENVYRMQVMNASESPQNFVARCVGSGLALATPATFARGAHGHWRNCPCD